MGFKLFERDIAVGIGIDFLEDLFGLFWIFLCSRTLLELLKSDVSIPVSIELFKNFLGFWMSSLARPPGRSCGFVCGE